MKLDLIQNAESLFEAGRHEEAEDCFQCLLIDTGGTTLIYNNLAVIAYHRGDFFTACKYLSKAMDLDPLNDDALHNIDMMVNARDIALTESRSFNLRNVRLAIVNAFDNKFNDIYRHHFAINNEVRVVKPQNHHDLETVTAWADVILSPWCNEPLSILSKLKKNHQKLFTHIRSYEILTPQLMSNVNWINIDGIIFVADHIRHLANQWWKTQIAALPQTTIGNCVSLNDYPFYRQNKGYNIAYIGYLNHKKGVGLLLQCMKEAVLLDPRYTFHIAGTFQEARFEVYMRHLIKEMNLENHVVFHGWVKDLFSFLETMNYVISTSPWEGCPNNVIEAMACGIKPLIHNWPGARQLFPVNLVFNTVCEFLAKLQDSYDSSYYRKWVEIHYNAEIQVRDIDMFMDNIMQSGKGLNNGKTN